jgi:hypothetical protein
MSYIEQKYCIGTSDGKYQIFWDITALLERLSITEVPIEYCKVSELSSMNHFKGNPQYAMSTDIEKPCIIVKLKENFEKLIDGNHRLYKADQLHLEYIPCYVLSAEYHKEFIINYDDYIYDRVIGELAK